MQPRAVIILAIGVPCGSERGDGAVAVTMASRIEASANQAVAKPGAVSSALA